MNSDKLHTLIDFWRSEANRIEELERKARWWHAILGGRTADRRQAARLTLRQCADDLQKALDA